MAKKKEKKKVGVTVFSQKDLAKKYPGSGYASQISIPKEKRLILPSRQLALNYNLGGGLHYGKIMELFGEESSGKTLLAQDFGYPCQALGGIIIWDDAEQSYTPEWAIANGLDPSRIILWNSTVVEKVSDWLADQAIYVRSILTHNEPILFIQDSTAALDCLDNINSAQTDAKAEMGNRAKAIYKMLRIRNELLSNLGVCSIFINQLRKKVGAGMFEDPDTTPGGGAMKFFASARIGIYGGKYLTGDINGVEDKLGRTSYIRIKKNKMAPPKPNFAARVYFNPHGEEPIGFNKLDGLIDIFLRLGIISKEGKGPYKFQGKSLAKKDENLLKLIGEDDDLRKKLLFKAGINTISRTQKMINAQDKNLYPIRETKVVKQEEAEDDEE